MAVHRARVSPNVNGTLAPRFGNAGEEAYRALDSFNRNLRTKGLNPNTFIGNDLEIFTADTLPSCTHAGVSEAWATCHGRLIEYYTIRAEWERAVRRAERRLHKTRQTVNASAQHLKRYQRQRADFIRLTAKPLVRVPHGWKGARRPHYEIKSLVDAEAWLQRELRYAQEWQCLFKKQHKSSPCKYLNATVGNFFRVLNDLGIHELPKRPDKASRFDVAEASVIQLLADVREILATNHQDNGVEAKHEADKAAACEQEKLAGLQNVQARGFVFRSSGNVVEIAGFGERGNFMIRKGFAQIAVLIRSSPKGVPIPMMDREAQDERLRCDQRSKQPIVDEKALSECNARLAELNTELEQERANHNTGKVVQLEKEKATIRKYVRSALKIGGKSRDLNSLNEKRRSKIWGTINTAIDAMRKAGMSKVAAHFEGSIKSEDGSFFYHTQNAVKPAWELE